MLTAPRGGSHKKKSRCVRNNGRVARKHLQKRAITSKNAKSPPKSAKTPPKTNKKHPQQKFRAYAQKISPDAKTKKNPMAPPGPSNRRKFRSGLESTRLDSAISIVVAWPGVVRELPKQEKCSRPPGRPAAASQWKMATKHVRK